jgi:hypothetical protein
MQNKIEFRGVTYLYSVFGRLITVTAPDGRQKITQLGDSPASALAPLMACELADEAPTKT